MAAPAFTAMADISVVHLLRYGLYALLLLVLYVAVNPVKRWRYRHIPGPIGWPFLGNFAAISKGLPGYIHQMRKQHGRIFKIWFGTHPWVVVCDPDAARKMASRLSHHNGLPNALRGEERYLIEHMAVFLAPEPWKVLKKVWDPAVMQRASLEGYVPVMQECADELVERIGAVPAGEVVDVHAEMSRTTMDVIGSIAFGIKFHDSSTGAQELGLGGDYLRAMAYKFLSSMDVDKSTAWMLPMYIFPDATEAIRLLAALFPDAGLKRMTGGMREMGEAARKLIKLSAAQRQHGEAAAALDAGVNSGALAAGARATGAPKGPQRVLPGSFVAQLEAWRAKHEGSMEISDNLLAAQVVTLLLAGYETSTHALGFLLYRLSVNPEAQRKVQQELDVVMGGRKPALDDLPKLVYLGACLKEAARLHTVAFGFSRVFHGHSGDPPTLELKGFSIPRKTVVLAASCDMHTDPQYWERPEEFLPERFLPEQGGTLAQRENPMFEFGYGARKCTGYKFAEQEMALVAAALLQRFSFARPPGEGPLKEKLGLTLSPKDGVKVLAQRRG